MTPRPHGTFRAHPSTAPATQGDPVLRRHLRWMAFAGATLTTGGLRAATETPPPARILRPKQYCLKSGFPEKGFYDCKIEHRQYMADIHADNSANELADNQYKDQGFAYK